MKRIINYAAIFLAGLAIASCSENESSDLSLGIGRDITVSTDGGAGITDPNDVNRFYMKITDKSNPRYNYYSLMEKENGEWVSYSVDEDGEKGSPQKLLWSSNSAEIEVTAICPPPTVDIRESYYNGVILGEDDLPTKEDIKKADWLYCTKTIYRHGDGDLQFDFKHLMSKIELEITMATEFNEVPGTQTNPLQDVRLNGLRSVKYNIEKDSRTNSYSMPHLIPCLTGYTPGNGTSQKAVADYVYLAPPVQSCGDFNVTLKINDKTYTWNTPTPITFESNKSYRLPIKVGKDYITMGDIMVSDWNEGSAFDDGESNLPNATKWDGTVASSIPGAGTQTDPYVISTGAQLAYLAQSINSGLPTFYGKMYFELANDINLDEKSWTPIGFVQSDLTGKAFNGVFDGKGHTIYGLNVDMTGQDKSAGLFGWVVGGDIKNLNIVNGSVKGDIYSALLTGNTTASSSHNPMVSNCHLSGKVTGKDHSAGLMGCGSYVDISGCTVNALIDADGRAGEICGETFKCNISNCTVRGKVSSSWSVGGMFGVMYYETKATDCISYARVDASDWHSGSFVGYMEDNCVATNCIAYGNVHSTCTNPRAGGFVGEMINSKLYSCSFMGQITASDGDSWGFFVGYDGGGNIAKDCTYDASKNTSGSVVYNNSSSSDYEIKGISE